MQDAGLWGMECIPEIWNLSIEYPKINGCVYLTGFRKIRQGAEAELCFPSMEEIYSRAVKSLYFELNQFGIKSVLQNLYDLAELASREGNFSFFKMGRIASTTEVLQGLRQKIHLQLLSGTQ